MKGLDVRRGSDVILFFSVLTLLHDDTIFSYDSKAILAAALLFSAGRQRVNVYHLFSHPCPTIQHRVMAARG